MKSTAWTLLVLAGLLEIVWATALKQSDGFTRLWPSVIGVGLSLVSFALLALRDLPVGTAYAVWVGVAIAGIMIYGEAASPVRLTCIAAVLAGVIGLRIIEG